MLLRQKCLHWTEDYFDTINIPEHTANEGSAPHNVKSEEFEERFFINDVRFGITNELRCFDLSWIKIITQCREACSQNDRELRITECR